MKITLTNDLTFIDCKVPKGTRADVLIEKYHKSIIYVDYDQYGLLKRLKAMYHKRGAKGVFAYLAGKWRWVEEEDF